MIFFLYAGFFEFLFTAKDYSSHNNNFHSINLLSPQLITVSTRFGTTYASSRWLIQIWLSSASWYRTKICSATRISSVKLRIPSNVYVPGTVASFLIMGILKNWNYRLCWCIYRSYQAIRDFFSHFVSCQ